MRYHWLLYLLLCCLGCASTVTPRYDLTCLQVGVSRQSLLERLGSPSRTIAFHGQLVDIFAYHDTTEDPATDLQLAREYAESLDEIKYEPVKPNCFPEDEPKEPEKKADYERRKDRFESAEEDRIRPINVALEAKYRADLELARLDYLSQVEQQARIGLHPEDLRDGIRVELQGQAIPYQNARNSEAGVPLVFAVNYNDQEHLQSVCFARGHERAKRQLNPVKHWWGYLKRQKHDYVQQPWAESVFQNPYQGKILTDEIVSTSNYQAESIFVAPVSTEFDPAVLPLPPVQQQVKP